MSTGEERERERERERECVCGGGESKYKPKPEKHSNLWPFKSALDFKAHTIYYLLSPPLTVPINMKGEIFPFCSS